MGTAASTCFLIASLYKHEVRDLAREIGVPERIIKRPPSAGLWSARIHQDEMGLTYEVLDRTLAAIHSGQTDDIDPATLQRVQGMVNGTGHKRQLAPIFVPGED